MGVIVVLLGKGKGKGRDMGDNTVESALFNDVAASNYGAIRNGVVVMEGNEIYRIQQYCIMFEHCSMLIEPVSDGAALIFRVNDDDGFLDWFGTMESYDKFIDVINGCTMSYGGIIR